MCAIKNCVDQNKLDTKRIHTVRLYKKFKNQQNESFMTETRKHVHLGRVRDKKETSV